MGKTALVEALRRFDVEGARDILAREPGLKALRLERGGFDLLQFCCKRLTADDPDKAARQLRMAKWLVGQGFDPHVTYATEPDEDGEESADVSLVWFAVAKAQNTRLARYFLDQGAAPGALYAAAWWGNAEIVPHLVELGADPNIPAHDGTTPLHSAMKKEYPEAFELLLEHGADPDVPGEDGRTVREIASRKRDESYFEALPRPSAAT